MPKMEKGRPPENKRSRKPAHPVKREVSQEMKSFAESTMNELLGWYGYDKVDLQDAEASHIRNFSSRTRHHHVSVLKENSEFEPSAVETKVPSRSSASTKNGMRESACFPLSPSSSSSSPHTKDLHSTPVVVPLIKPSTVEEQQNIQIVCVWCQKEGQKRYSLMMGSELKSFCSEKCFAMCRRAYFKRNKARDEDQHSNQSPPSPGKIETPPRLMLKMNSNTRVCDWCKHVRHSKYLDFGAGEERLQFCSTKCLNQYKMDIFYREARAALTTTGSSPSHKDKESHPVTEENQALLTPESWDNPSLEGENNVLSPKEATMPLQTSTASIISSSSSSLVRAPVRAQREQELNSSQLQSGRPTPCFAADQMQLLQNPPPFLRPPLQAQGLHSPVHQQPRNPVSNPIHRPLHPSSQLQTPSICQLPPPHILHPYSGPVFPCASTYPHPIPPLVPSLGLPSPQPTLLVPYPIIIPLPVPVPIPIPIHLGSGVSTYANVIRNSSDKRERENTLVISGDLTEQKMTGDTEVTNFIEHRVKTEESPSPLDSCTSPFSSLTSQSSSTHADSNATPPLSADNIAELRDEGRECQVFQRVFHRLLVKQETEVQAGFEQRETEQWPGWNPLEIENDSTVPQSLKRNTGTLTVPSVHTNSSTLTQVSSPTHTLTTSIVLRKTVNQYSSNMGSIITPTVSVLRSNTSPEPASSYSPTYFPTIQATSVTSDRPNSPSKNRAMSVQILGLSPDSKKTFYEKKEVEDNFSAGWEFSSNHTCTAEEKYCQTDQSEKSTSGPTEDALTADEEHTYAQSILQKLREKNIHTITRTAAHTLAHKMHNWDKDTNIHLHDTALGSVHLDAEPALKRRCL